MLSQEWSEFLEGGVAIIIAGRTRDLLADAVRSVGAVVSLDRRIVTFYVVREAALRLLPLFEETREVAVAVAQPSTYKAIQIKGRYASSRESDARDRFISDRYRDLFFDEVRRAGVPHDSVERMALWPTIAIDVEVRDIFISTPGADAGGVAR